MQENKAHSNQKEALMVNALYKITASLCAAAIDFCLLTAIFAGGSATISALSNPSMGELDKCMMGGFYLIVTLIATLLATAGTTVFLTTIWSEKRS